MLDTQLMGSLATLIAEERVEERRFDRAIRNQRAKQVAQRNLSREIERLLKADGNAQSVLDVLENVAARSHVQIGKRAKPACCS